MRAAGHRLSGLRFRRLSPRPLDFPCFIRMESRAAISTGGRPGHFLRGASRGTFLLHRDDLEFLPWLRRKSGREISSMLSIGFSTYGRSLFSSRDIHAGECILSVPYSVQITPDNIPYFLKPVIANDVGDIGQLAIVLLAERRGGQDSEWAPYVSSLPRVDDMHCLMFWSDDELEMIQSSLIHQEALHQRTWIEDEFLAVKPVLDHFSEIFGDISLKSFMHAYALVGSRAWGTSKGLSLIPFADFLNHDGNSENVLMSDEDNETSEVISGRDYAAGEQVLIRYGKFPNATLLLDFGFTLPENNYDQVHILMDVPPDDPLYTTKVELLQKHCMPRVTNASTNKSASGSFTIKEVRSIHGMGKGIPPSLRAFARVLSAKSLEELEEMRTEASENDGRLARRSLRSRSREIEAHRILISKIVPMIQSYDASIESLKSLGHVRHGAQRPCRVEMARDLLAGELRVLKSACSWLSNYCSD